MSKNRNILVLLFVILCFNHALGLYFFLQPVNNIYLLCHVY